MAGYSGIPLWKKLGYKNDETACVDGAPPRYIETLDLPAQVSVRWLAQPKHGINFVHLFCSSKAKLEKKLKALRNQIDPGGVIWVSSPKKSSGVATDITEDVIMEIALPLGLVDIKVCAVDQVWSGLKLMIRKELRA
jgi:hypothetical protein